MDGARAFEFAETDERHLHEAAAVAPVKIGVRLDAVDEHRAVRLEDLTVHEDPVRQISARQLDDLHRRAHRGAHCGFGDPVQLRISACPRLSLRRGCPSRG